MILNYLQEIIQHKCTALKSENMRVAGIASKLQKEWFQIFSSLLIVSVKIILAKNNQNVSLFE